MVVEAIVWMLVGPAQYRNITSLQQPSLVILETMAASGSVLAYIFVVWVFEQRRLRTVGFAAERVGRELGLGLLIGASLMSVVIAVEAATGVYRVHGFNTRFGIGIWLMTFLLTAIFEEVSFRGCVLRVVGERWGTWTGLIASSLIFGIVHVLNPTPGLTTWQHIAGPLFISLEAGLLMGGAYILTRKLWMPIGIHWAWNFFEGPIYGTGVSGIPAPSLFRAHIQGPFLLTGGSFGPEAGLPCLIICTLAAVALIRKTQRLGRWDMTTPD
jgi:hypothetical protein